MAGSSDSPEANKPAGGINLGDVSGGIRDTVTAGRDANVTIGQRITNFIFGDTEQQRTQRNRQAMLQLVRNLWVKGVLEQSLHGAAMIEFGLEERTEAVEHPWDMVVRASNRPDPALVQCWLGIRTALVGMGERKPP